MWLFFTTLGSFSKMSDTTMLDLSGDHKPLCQRVFSVQSSIDIMGRCYSSTMNRWKFMFHKIMLHSVPTNFRDNSSILVIFVVASHSHPFFSANLVQNCALWANLQNDKCVNLFGWIMTQKCSNFFVNFSFNWKSHFSVLPTQSLSKQTFRKL